VEFKAIAGSSQQHVVSQAGEGPDIVLLHGFPDTPYSWEGIEATLVDAGWRVTVPWLRGYHPDTIVPGRDYKPETLGRDALGLLDAIGVRRAVLFGHDWGALLSYLAAGLEPSRVRALITSGIPHPSVLRRTPQAMWSVHHFVGLKLPWASWSCRRNDFAYLDRLYRRWAPGWSGPKRDETLRRAKEALSTQTTLHGSIGYYRDLPLNGAPALERVGAVPGLIVGGDHAIGEQKLYERTASLLPAPSRALIVAGAGHWPHRENTAAVMSEVLRFLAELGE
jgi:pimeloyl-ACP methyl ester carboxylesterase